MDQQLNHSTTPQDYRCIDAKCHSVQQQHDKVNSDFQMKENVHDGMDRKLQPEECHEAVAGRADEMEVGVMQFTQNATHLQRHMWWNHARMAVALTAASMLVVIGTVLLVVAMSMEPK
uniref:V-SNARE coiled-coil homology domain-containing protein n=1 Tax=Parascaris univalens TaxID=6257 RepID=A0A915C6M7_PARUN